MVSVNDTADKNPRLERETGVALTIANIAEPVLEGLGFRLVGVRVSGQGNSQVQVMAERPEDGMLNIDECVTISRALSPELDVHDPIKGKYNLEISSPGIARPLVRPSDFENFAGHVAKIELREPLAGRKRFKGPLEGFLDGEVRLYVKPSDGSEDTVLVGLPFEAIAEAKLVMTDDLLKLSQKPGETSSPGDGSEIDINP